ncbi:MAG: Maf family protein [Pleomorphochaeta sp.]
MKTIILASNSTARLNLLKDAGFNVIVKGLNINETSTKLKPEEIVTDLASQKLEAYINKYGTLENKIILAADTMIFHKNELIGKAKNKQEAYNILKRLSNDKHQIYSGYAIYLPNKGIKIGYNIIDITFKNLTDLSIMDYLFLDEWKGAAGAYRIQGIGCSLVKETKGEFSVAVGLPLNEISALIKSS